MSYVASVSEKLINGTKNKISDIEANHENSRRFFTLYVFYKFVLSRFNLPKFDEFPFLINDIFFFSLNLYL